MAVLATGVFATVLLLGLFTFYLGSDWKFGILMAAVSVRPMRARCSAHAPKQRRCAPERARAGNVEIESGANDPMVFWIYGADWRLIIRSGPDFIVPVVLIAATRLRPAAGLAQQQDTDQAGDRLNLAEGWYALMIVSGRAAGVRLYRPHRRQRVSGGVPRESSSATSTAERLEHVLRVMMDGPAY